MKPGISQASARRPLPFRGRHLAVLSLWLVLLGGYQLYAWRQGLTPLEAASALVHFLVRSMAGPLIYLAFFLVRPLILFPASLLAVAAGFLFGPVSGVVLTAVGCNASATIAYLVGRFLGGGVGEPSGEPSGSGGAAQRYAGKIRENGFEAVLTVQLVYLPFDLTNYLAGFPRVGWKTFALATALGSLPGVVSFVLLGASVEMDLATGAMGLDFRALLASAAILVGSITLSRYFKRREQRREETEPDEA